jgi:VIT1/CCC1 family predicted Fe2+/Mn2+ transporter
MGLLILGILSFKIAREQKRKPWKVVMEHVVIALVVVIATHFAGDWISSMLG